MDFLVRSLLAFGFLLVILYKYGTRTFHYWKKKGVKQLNPLPFVGDNIGLWIKEDPLRTNKKYYEPFKATRFGGIYVNQTPLLSVTDPELLKLIMVKDADHFLNRHDWFKGNDTLMSKNLVNLKDDEWRKMRVVMTSVFTSAKMKDMFGFMDRCAKQSVDYLEKELKSSNSGKTFHEIDCKDFFSRYGTDVIASTAFGLEVDSFRNPDNEFYSSGLFIRGLFTGWSLLKVVFTSMFPSMCKKLGVQLLDTKYTEFFTKLIEETIREREEKNIVRKDVIHILMEARKGKGVTENGDLIRGKLPDLTDVDIAAQGLVFFFGGFETMASLLGFITYELAVNPDVQEKVQQEIDEVIEKENGVTYEGIVHKMQYLAMVLSETLRKWPTAVMTDRQVTKTYVIPKTDTSPEVVLNKGDSIWIPIAAFHRDPDYFPDPDKFDPERFRDEKNDIKPFTYLPFGEGLRHCIGMRYAQMEVKVILVRLLQRFTLVPSEKTLIPMKLSNQRPLSLEPLNGFYVGLRLRK